MPAADRTGPDRTLDRLRRPAQGGKIEWAGYVFVAFFTVPFFLFNILPVLFGGYIAFTEWSIVGAPRWVGMQNFKTAASDPWVRNAFFNAFFYGLIIVPGVTCLGLCAALFVNRRWPLSSIARTMFFAPYVVSATKIFIKQNN